MKNEDNSQTIIILVSIIAFAAMLFIVDSAINYYNRHQAINALNEVFSSLSKDTNRFTAQRAQRRIETRSPFKYPQKRTNILKPNISKPKIPNYEIIDLKTPYIRWAN